MYGIIQSLYCTLYVNYTVIKKENLKNFKGYSVDIFLWRTCVFMCFNEAN